MRGIWRVLRTLPPVLFGNKAEILGRISHLNDFTKEALCL